MSEKKYLKGKIIYGISNYLRIETKWGENGCFFQLCIVL